ncbi:MAG: YfiR family protein [Pseudomonadota bacterium]
MRILAAVAVLPAWTALARDTADPGVPERNVKAAFLYKFLGYTDFPAAVFGDANAPVVIGVVGADDIAAELGRIVDGRNVNGRPIVVRVGRESEPMAGVHLLFVGGADSARVARLLKALPQQPMLLVTESENGLQNGSVINFKLVDARVRFDVSLEAAERHSIKLSSRLLTVAHQVVRGSP